MNLIECGTHEVADTVLARIRSSQTPHTLWVGPGGMVTIANKHKSWRRSQPPPDADLVGVYGMAAAVSAIREDLDVRLQEIRG